MTVVAEIAATDAGGTPRNLATLPELGQTTATGSLPIVLASDAPLPLPAPVYPTSSANAESSHVLAIVPGAISSLSVNIGATSGYVMLFDAIAAPADGAVAPKWCQYVTSDGTSGGLNHSWAPGPPLQFSTGIVVVFSTTGPFTKTASATAFFSAQIQTYLPALPNLTLAEIAELVNTLFSTYATNTTTSGAVNLTPTSPFSIYKFTLSLIGNLTITISTTGMSLGNRCRVISPTALGGFAMTVNSVGLYESQFVEFSFDGSAWVQIDAGSIIPPTGSVDFTSPYNSSLIGAIVA